MNYLQASNINKTAKKINVFHKKITCSRASILSRRLVRHRKAACLFRSRRTRRFSNSSEDNYKKK